MQDRAQLKLNSKKLIRESKGKVYIVALFYVVISFSISILLGNLSGYTQYIQERARNYAEAYSEVQDVTKEYGNTEEAVERVRDITYAALEKPVKWPKVEAFGIILSVVLFFLDILFRSGYVNCCMLVSRRQKADKRDILNGFIFPGRLIAISILRIILIVIGSVFLIIPGLIVLYSYRMVYYVAFDNPELGVIGCLKKARQLVKGKKLELFKLDLSLIGWRLLSYVVSAISIPILDVWVEPYVGITVAQWYNNSLGYVPQEEGTDK